MDRAMMRMDDVKKEEHRIKIDPGECTNLVHERKQLGRNEVISHLSDCLMNPLASKHCKVHSLLKKPRLLQLEQF